MSDESEIRVGPTFQYCEECGASDDGYGFQFHYETCSKAPQGKRRKAEGTLVREEDLPDELREVLRSRPAPNGDQK
jgi:hypothetical protein